MKWMGWDGMGWDGMIKTFEIFGAGILKLINLI